MTGNSAAPEPSVWAMLFLGLFTLGAALGTARRKTLALPA